ncbi:hypothetical protein SAY87_007139 [Trapa incisa]|uniref:Uncharacterized protein n=1 Tax=Trapa incisa TaxID=236973 RepID=A0AAN7K2C7_9MYRT|nr:hypothetical protein SAY87_007139 [Trapa incisa]
MATRLVLTVTTLRPAPIRASASSGSHKQPDHRHGSCKKPTSTTGWWTPLFGWSIELDYPPPLPNQASKLRIPDRRSSADPRQARSRISGGGFTEEKARQLRMMTVDTATFHDAMYHSAIASHPASDFDDWGDDDDDL